MLLKRFTGILSVLFLVIKPDTVWSKPADKLILLLIDGFRWDYFNFFDMHSELPGFVRMFREGIKANYLTPTYPTESYPNYYSIMTGRYPENHGFVGNYMYDTEHKESFLIGTNKEQYLPFWWEDAEPLWVTAEKQNLRTSWYYWLGTEVTIFGRNSTYVTPYTKVPTMDEMESAIRSGVKDIVDRSVSVVGIYVEAPDKMGHTYGPASDEVLRAIRDIDSKLRILMEELDANELTQTVNILIFSDHGMTSKPIDKVANMGQAIDDRDIFKKLWKDSYSQIWPKEGRTDKVFNALNKFHPNISVYKKEDLPERYRLKNHERTAPIILAADLHWTMVLKEVNPNTKWRLGGHGFDNEEQDMRGIFLATGPAFKSNHRTQGFDNIHIYSLMCHLLQITPATNDGKWNSVSDMLLDSSASVCPTLTMTLVVCVVFAMM